MTRSPHIRRLSPLRIPFGCGSEHKGHVQDDILGRRDYRSRVPEVAPAHLNTGKLARSIAIARGIQLEDGDIMMLPPKLPQNPAADGAEAPGDHYPGHEPPRRELFFEFLLNASDLFVQ